MPLIHVPKGGRQTKTRTPFRDRIGQRKKSKKNPHEASLILADQARRPEVFKRKFKRGTWKVTRLEGVSPADLQESRLVTLDRGVFKTFITMPNPYPPRVTTTFTTSRMIAAAFASPGELLVARYSSSVFT